MTTQTDSKLNQLERVLPEGLIVDSQWLSEAGFSSSLRSKYVSAGWLEQPARRVYRRPRGELTWEHVVLSLQTILKHQIVVGGRTALEILGYSHYVKSSLREIHLYGTKKLPKWVASLPLNQNFIYHNSEPLFGGDLEQVATPKQNWSIFLRKNIASSKRRDNEWQISYENRAKPLHKNQLLHVNFDLKDDADTALATAALRTVPSGLWTWVLTVSTAERAFLELLDELPEHESFDQVDALMEGLTDLGPRRLQTLLGRCQSVKVKRLFFFFADRHNHDWLKHIDRENIDLGRGKRSLVKNGKLDQTYLITVPRDLKEPD